MMRHVLVTLGVLIGTAAGVPAQPITNPGTVTLTASPDHATVTRYEVGLFVRGAATPAVVQPIGKPAPNAQNEITAAITTTPLADGAYELKGRAVVEIAHPTIPPVTVTSIWAAGGAQGVTPVPFDRAAPVRLRLP